MSTFISSVRHLALVGLLLAAGNCGAAEAADKETLTEPMPFALVELYTSEGCSSCPPADDVASAIAKKQTPGVYVVAFHVDYWDYLGWKDVFSSAESTERQREYSRVTRSSSLYTPQMIVNGTNEFVGSNRSKADSAISTALTKKPAFVISGSAMRSGEVVTVTPVIKDAPKETTIVAALVQDGLVTDVKKGENGGRKLHHDRVVRSFTSKAWDGVNAATLTLQVPAGVSADDLEVIVWAERANTREVLAATAMRSVAAAEDGAKSGEKTPKIETPATSATPAKP